MTSSGKDRQRRSLLDLEDICIQAPVFNSGQGNYNPHTYVTLYTEQMTFWFCKK
jgi:hypothetical protein